MRHFQAFRFRILECVIVQHVQLAQLVGRRALDPVVVGTCPTSGDVFLKLKSVDSISRERSRRKVNPGPLTPQASLIQLDQTAHWPQKF